MVSETVRGKKCPGCSSFIKDGLNKCEICGFAIAEKEKTGPPPSSQNDKAWFSPLLCPQCGTGNQSDFNFCKMCKHPLHKNTTTTEKKAAYPGEKPAATIKKPFKKAFIELHWLEPPEPPQQEIKNKLELINGYPFFTGYARWNDYAFGVYHLSNRFEVLVRKINVTGHHMLYRKCGSITLLKDEHTLCLGQLALCLAGNAESGNPEKTVLVGPGTVTLNPGKNSRGIRVVNMAAEKGFIGIREKCRIGRDWLAQQFGLDKELLRTGGVSKECIEITPLEDGKWLLDPLDNKNFFAAIEEAPESLKEGETIRWVRGQSYGDFQLKIKITEV